MASQPNPFAPTEGPFTPAITPQVSQSAQQAQNQGFTGYERRLGIISGLAAKFLSGLQQGRLAAYQRREAEKVSTLSRVAQWVDAQVKDPTKTDEFKSDITNKFAKIAAGSVLENLQDGGGKGKKGQQSNPVGHAFSQILEGMIGGPLKGEAISKDTLIDLMTTGEKAGKAPEAQKSNWTNRANQLMQEAVQETTKQTGRQPFQQEIAANPKFQQAEKILQQYDPKGYQTAIQGVLGPFDVRPAAGSSESERMRLGGELGLGAPPAVRPPEQAQTGVPQVRGEAPQTAGAAAAPPPVREPQLPPAVRPEATSGSGQPNEAALYDTAQRYIGLPQSGAKGVLVKKPLVDGKPAPDLILITGAGKADGYWNPQTKQRVSGEVTEAQSLAGKKLVWVQRPGAEEPEQAYVSPGEKGYTDISGNLMPDGTKGVATPTQQRLYGMVQAYYYAFKKMGKTDLEARELAGQAVTERENIHLGRIQQQALLDEALSGGRIGIGPGLNIPGIGTEAGGGKPQAPSVRGEEKPEKRPPGSPKPPISSMDAANINQALSALSGTIPQSGKAAQAGVQIGLKKLAELTGLDPISLQGALITNKGMAKGIADTMERYVATDRLNKIITLDGEQVIDTGAKISDTGMQLLNRPFRELTAQTIGDPNLRKYWLAWNALRRQYSTVTAGGGLSRAMLPVTVQQDVDRLMNSEAKMSDVKAMVDQIAVEAKLEQQGFKDSIKGIIQEMQESPIGKAVRGAGAGDTNDPLGVLKKQ